MSNRAMKPINDFIRQYNKEFDFYQELSKIVSNKLEDQILKRGIKAIVTHRAKRPDRLKEKLIKRNETRKYETAEEISADIVDLAGVRASLYFPSERDVVDEVINDTFIVEEKKVFPDKEHKPKYDKRFSGYWANHYRVKLKDKDDPETKRYADTIVEIQVASVLMHAWSEVEHDLVYKPLSGNLSQDELAILDEINGLVLSGEIALERLQRAMAERTKQQNEISDRYELTNFIINSVKDDLIKKIKLGDVNLLNNYYNNIEKINVDAFKSYIDHINPDVNESITDQILNMLITDNQINDINFKKYFKYLKVPERKASGFESFVKCWVILEQAVRALGEKYNMPHSPKYIVPNFNQLETLEILSADEVQQLQYFRRVRNQLLHGIEIPTDEYLQKSFEGLKDITKKLINKVSNRNLKTKLNKDLSGI